MASGWRTLPVWATSGSPSRHFRSLGTWRLSACDAGLWLSSSSSGFAGVQCDPKTAETKETREKYMQGAYPSDSDDLGAGWLCHVVDNATRATHVGTRSGHSRWPNTVVEAQQVPQLSDLRICLQTKLIVDSTKTGELHLRNTQLHLWRAALSAAYVEDIPGVLGGMSGLQCQVITEEVGAKRGEVVCNLKHRHRTKLQLKYDSSSHNFCPRRFFSITIKVVLPHGSPSGMQMSCACTGTFEASCKFWFGEIPIIMACLNWKVLNSEGEISLRSKLWICIHFCMTLDDNNRDIGNIINQAFLGTQLCRKVELAAGTDVSQINWLNICRSTRSQTFNLQFLPHLKYKQKDCVHLWQNRKVSLCFWINTHCLEEQRAACLPQPTKDTNLNTQSTHFQHSSHSAQECARVRASWRKLTFVASPAHLRFWQLIFTHRKRFWNKFSFQEVFDLPGPAYFNSQCQERLWLINY